MEFDKEKLDELRKDPVMRTFSSLLGIDLDEVVNGVVSEPGTENETKKPIEKQEPQYDDRKQFLLSVDELKEFINKYLELENMFKKLNYAFGIDFNSGSNNIYTRYNELIWVLIRKIFGEDNAEDIADYIFDNSNFDSVESLYNELT